MKDRKKYWLDKGYTQEQIENHLSYERYKQKLSRERRKRNNEANNELIQKIKSDLLGTDFDDIKILSIRPSTDGQGFWFKYHRTFKDGSHGDFRSFAYFEDYSLREFLENIWI
jgi:hypothetical protein